MPLERDLEMNISWEQFDIPQQRARSPLPSRRAPLLGAFSMPEGYPRLAELMGRLPQMGIYRRFGYLNAQNLLFMQAELMSLENSLKRLQKRDAEEIHNQALHRARDWNQLSKATFRSDEEAGVDNTGNSHFPGASCCGHRRCECCCGEREPHEHCDQWSLAMKIREKLQRYNDALIQQMALASADAPDFYGLEWIQRFLNSDHFGMKDALLGDDRIVWGGNPSSEGADHVDDLITLTPVTKRDPFNEWIFKKLAKRILDPKSWWNSVLRNRSLEDKALLKWTAAAAGSVTAAVPIVSTMALYLTPNNSMRLVLLAFFNILAAFFLYCITDAQPMQIFTICAAWNAVNIVFVGSNATGGT